MNARIASLALLLCATAPMALAGEGWHDDFDAALAVAKKEKKDLLVEFTGSDWCPPCIRLHQEVFGVEQFTQSASRNFVLVALDFPRKEPATSKVPNPTRNAEVRDQHGVEGYPTVLLMTPEGDVYASTGYRPGGADAYLAHLEEIAGAGRKALVETKALVAEFEKAKDGEKLAHWEKALALLESLDEGSPFASKVAGIVRWAFGADPKNERGLKQRAVEALLAAGQVDEETIAAGRELDPKNERGLFERLVERQFMTVGDDKTAKAALEALDALAPAGFRDAELGFRLNFTAARWCAGPLQDPERGKKYARIAKALGSDDEDALEFLDELIDG